MFKTKRSTVASFFLLFLIIFFLPLSVSKSQPYSQNGGTVTLSNQNYTSSVSNISGVLVYNSGIFNLSNSTISTTGNSLSTDSSSQYGLNAGVLSKSASITMSACSVATIGSGANGLFATGTNSSITLSNGTIYCTGGNAHGVDVTYKGAIILNNVNIITTGASSSAIATDFGGGTVTVTGGVVSTSATHSAGIYSTGNISVTGATIKAAGDNGSVIDADGIINLTNTSLAGSQNGLMVHNTVGQMSLIGVFNITGGSLTGNGGDAFYITGAKANITVKGATSINSSSGNLVNEVSSGIVTFSADGETLNGNIVTDGSGTITASLINSTNLTGHISSASLTIDTTSTWTLTANSTLTSLSDPNGVSGLSITNIIGNGHSVHYDSSLAANSWLGGKIYSLVNGGQLTPGIVTDVNNLKNVLPSAFTLYQNYPNPFNPSTSISYLLPHGSFISLKIFNILGKEITTLVNEFKPAGNYTVSFNAFNLASGMYICQMRAGSFVTAKKMQLLK